MEPSHHEIPGPEAEIARLRRECDRLTFELGHRVKNTLGTVQALANQTFRHTDGSAEALGAFSDRVAALSRANDAILEDSWTTASVRSVASRVLMPLGHPLGRLALDGPDVRVPAGNALSFAMALGELATNARRYGAWSQPDGTVSLTWSVLTDDGEETLTLDWTEVGGPALEEPASRQLGLRLAEQLLKSAFGRNVTFVFETPGFSCHVRGPAPASTLRP